MIDLDTITGSVLAGSGVLLQAADLTSTMDSGWLSTIISQGPSFAILVGVAFMLKKALTTTQDRHDKALETARKSYETEKSSMIERHTKEETELRDTYSSYINRLLDAGQKKDDRIDMLLDKFIETYSGTKD